MKILLVDDDILLRDMYKTKFVEQGDEVVTARDGEEALEAITKDNFDVMITDMVMPGMTGTELIRAVKTKEENKNVFCIVLSNQSEPTDIKDAEEAGADGYIVKAELIPSAVVNRVHELIKR